jgi:hypothetical protein
MKAVIWILVGVMGLIGMITSVNGVGSFEPGKAIPAAMIGVVLGLIYFIPAFIAMSRKHPNQLAIVVLNAVAGWTFLGWVGGLIWSLVGPKQESR